MAGKNGNGTVTEHEEDEPQQASRVDASRATGRLPAEFQQDENSFERILAELSGEGGKVVAYRLQSGKEVYVGTFAASEFSVEMLAEAKGGGDYRLRFRNRTGFAGSANVSIDGTIKAAAAPTPESVRIDPALATVLETQKAILDELRSLRAAPSVPQMDPTEQLLKLSQIAKNLQQPAVTVDPATVSAMAEMRAELRELRAERNKGGMSSIEETVNLLKTARELFPEGGGESDGSFLSSLAKGIAEYVAPLVMPKASAAPVPEPAEKLLPGATATPADATPPPAPSAGDSLPTKPEQAIGLAEPLREAVFSAAAANQSVKEFDALLCDNLPVSHYNRIADALDGDDWQQVLFGDDPRAEQHKVWLTNLRAVILDDGEDDESK